MSKRENKVDKFIEYETSYKLAPGDKITFYCSNIGKGNLIGESITNNLNTVMKVVYSEEDNLLGLVSLTEDNSDT